MVYYDAETDRRFTAFIWSQNQREQKNTANSRYLAQFLSASRIGEDVVTSGQLRSRVKVGREVTP